MTACRYKIRIKGTVQGIGFRPFVYREAAKNSIAGHVFNDSNGVTIEAEGRREDVENFCNTVRASPPPFAQILSFEHEEISPAGGDAFRILKSRVLSRAETLISPDIATCSECLSDITGPSNRRYRYPFTNCTNCGPRYTIIESVPYDRPYTAMKHFKMCPDCESEYNEPLDRRYHAQPNCCPVCGPEFALVCLQANVYSPRSKESDEDAIIKTAKLLKEGKIVAIKGLGGFHLACDATDEAAVLRLRKRKMRDEKPFAVMMQDADTVREYCELNDAEERILMSPQRPIVLLHKKAHTHQTPDARPPIAEAVAPNNCYLGVMLPYTPIHHLLFTGTPAHQHTRTLIMTSANISDEPICFENEEAFGRLKDIADYFLIHNRDIHVRTDDSITRVIGGRPLILRRARGYAPQPVILSCSQRHEQILAVGGGLKNTICLLKGNKAFISQHIGDLENRAACESFEKTIDHLRRLFDINPTVIAHDMHPEYFSTKWAIDRTGVPACRRTGIQHHHAHIASCMAENQIGGPVIGIALDGTGYGTDGNIWGGELLKATFKGFERLAHFGYVPLPGGDAGIKNPWQVAVSYLSAGVPECRSAAGIKGLLSPFQSIPDEKIDLVLNMIEKGINSPLTSSCGRLFDAVSAIIGLKGSISFEGQAALELEMEANKATISKTGIDNANIYPYKIEFNKPLYTMDYMATIKAILDDLSAGISRPEIALRFHNTIAAALTDVTIRLSRELGIRDIALSGGCFQNVLLTENLKKSLERMGLTVYTHSLIPPNDGGISLGQAVIAASR